ncbi:chromosomal replication initiator protein DnaA [Roseibium sediminicola]|uniref:Chromosomal replication initiator protein DnaA n=1 Tax=Roseibium sediminicola TaxID=2933272 RepID=A0ABT0GN68_9HYPH|nr:chromosomal replication initiator protein DnaA [Roseibium sp. CAU 1639]MCK7610864.1 chromosomal replication initiator protein DnaA [Roseibium sp. CAU 1639]
MQVQNLAGSDQWDRVKKELRSELGDDVFSNWFGRVNHEETTGDAVRLSVPTRFLKNWIQSHYEKQLVGLWKREQDDIKRIELTVRGALRPRQLTAGHAPKAITARRISGRPGPFSSTPQFGAGASVIPCLADTGEEAAADFLNGAALNPKLTFDTFAEGASNSLACAAVRQMAAGHEGTLDMLFIHSTTGIGKTHLLQAAACEARKTGRQVAYLSAEFFMYHLVPALRTPAFPVLRQAMRSIDLLLVDDLQFLHGKQGQEEFAKTLEMLMEAPSQIIMASDRSPDELDTLGDTLRQRIQKGEIVGIQATDYALRQDILKKRVTAARRTHPGFSVPEDVADYIARYVISSARDLEGALNRLFAHNQLTKQPVTMDLAEKTLHDLVRIGEPRSIKVEEIQQVVCKHFSVTKADLLSSCRARTLVRPRQIAMYIAKVMTGRSLPEIGRRFGNRDHTTVLHAVRKIEDMVRNDKGLAQEVELLKRLVHA